MWERTLQDLIRGMRANKKDESQFIAQAVAEIREEIKSKDMELKAAAVLKLTYLEMMGYDMKWAAFYVVEVMSSPKLHLKSLGYLAASQSFDQDTDVLMLTTNLLKKDVNSNPNDASVALDGLSNIVTPDLARDLSRDLYAILNHSRVSIRKRAVLVLYKLFLRFPETLEQNFSRLKEKLEDPDPGVVSATINVLCELSRTRPKDYLPLAPHLFHLLNNSSNNWMLIKIVKLFGQLTPLEPRLVKKLHGPISELIRSTPAISLLYECVRTCITGAMLDGPSGHALAETCVNKLATFLQDTDQNLKYIALLALVKIVPSHPHLIAPYQDMLIASVEDTDLSIRMRALELLSAMVDQNNIQSIVQQLLSQLVNPQSSSGTQPTATESLIRTASGIPLSTSSSADNGYRYEVSRHILQMCSRSDYENIDNFEWLLSVLVDLAYVARVDVGSTIRDCLIDVVLREPSTRPYAVKLMSKLLEDDTFIINAGESGGCAEVLGAAGWICGEYASLLGDPTRLLRAICQPGLAALSPAIVMTLISAAIKIFGDWTAAISEDWDHQKLETVKSVSLALKEGIEVFTSHFDLEVQERACTALQLLLLVTVDVEHFNKPNGESSPAGSTQQSEPAFPKSLFLLKPFFAPEIRHVKNIPSPQLLEIPPEVDFDVWLVPSEEARSTEIDRVSSTIEPSGLQVRKGAKKSKAPSQQTSASAKDKKRKAAKATEGTLHPNAESSSDGRKREQMARERMQAQNQNPYYIGDTSKGGGAPDDDLDSIPIVNLSGLILDAEKAVSSGLTEEELTSNGSAPQPSTSLLDADWGGTAQWAEGDVSEPRDTPMATYEHEEALLEPETTKVVKVKKKKKLQPKSTGT